MDQRFSFVEGDSPPHFPLPPKGPAAPTTQSFIDFKIEANSDLKKGGVVRGGREREAENEVGKAEVEARARPEPQPEGQLDDQDRDGKEQTKSRDRET